MILGTIKLIGRASTIIWVAKKGYNAYQTGTVAYKTYKQVKSVKSNTKEIVSTVKMFNSVIKSKKK